MEHRTYTKINTLYKRYKDGSLKNCIILGDFSDVETEYLKDNLWLCFEKVDGTNMSYYWDGHEREIHGKSENAQIPKPLKEKMEKLVTPEMLAGVFPIKYNEDGTEKPYVVRIYGEGYGGNIQGKLGKGYKPKGDTSFIVFDVCVDEWWLNHDAVVEIANKLGLETCPLIGEMTIPEAEEMVKKGFKSVVAEDGELMAEGLVCRPKIPLFNRKGERIIVKIKTCDYRDLERKENKVAE